MASRTVAQVIVDVRVHTQELIMPPSLQLDQVGR
jgi:hypothetical protein